MPGAAGAATTTAPPPSSWTALEKIAFSDGDKAVTVYISLDGAGDVPRERVSAEFGARSFDVKVRGVRGRDYRCRVAETWDTLDAAKCRLRVKPDKLVLTLAKGPPLRHFGQGWEQLGR